MRRVQPDVIRLVEHGHFRDQDVPDDCHVRAAPGRRAPQSRATYTTDPDDAVAGRTEVPNGQRRRAPNQTTTVSRITPPIGEATTTTGAAPDRLSEVGLACVVPACTDCHGPKEKTPSTRRPYNGCA